MPKYTIQEALTVIPATNANHLYVILHRLRHELEPPSYAYGEFGRRYRLLSARDVQHINKRIKPTWRGIMRWLRCQS